MASWLDTFGRMVVILIVVFDWVFDMAEKSTERVRRWRAMNEDRKKEINRKAAKTYYDKNKDDPEFMNRRREQKAEWARKNYQPAAEMTPEELEEHRRKNRERMAAYRAAKKAQAAADKEKKE